MGLITIQDFKKGKFELHTGMYAQASIQDYIDRYEKKYLIMLLGVTLYDEFEADLVVGGGSVPTEARFLKIFNSFGMDNFGGVLYSEGILEMLKGFIYFEYVKDLTNQMTPNGNVIPVGENSQNGTTLYSMMYARYNESCLTYKVIQHFINFGNEFDYSGFSGNEKGFAYWI